MKKPIMKVKYNIELNRFEVYDYYGKNSEILRETWDYEREGLDCE